MSLLNVNALVMLKPDLHSDVRGILAQFEERLTIRACFIHISIVSGIVLGAFDASPTLFPHVIRDIRQRDKVTGIEPGDCSGPGNGAESKADVPLIVVKEVFQRLTTAEQI